MAVAAPPRPPLACSCARARLPGLARPPLRSSLSPPPPVLAAAAPCSCGRAPSPPPPPFGAGARTARPRRSQGAPPRVAQPGVPAETAESAKEGGTGPPPPPPEPQQRDMPPWLWRALAAGILLGKVVVRVCTGRVHTKNTIEQFASVGPRSLFVSLLTSSFVGMVFTIQFVREFMRLGLTRSVGGVIALALARELTPAITAVIFAGRVGSAFAAELGTMQVSEQTDSLRVLRTDPVDYLVVPRVLACVVALPVVTILCFTVGMAASVLLAEVLYDVSANTILDSAAQALAPWDIISMELKAAVFGVLVAIISCAFGVTTRGGAKGVGLSTTSSVVCSLVCIFIVDFFLSFLFFQGLGDALKSCMPSPS